MTAKGRLIRRGPRKTPKHPRPCCKASLPDPDSLPSGSVYECHGCGWQWTIYYHDGPGGFGGHNWRRKFFRI